jgi:type II secretory pathway predicted ATPase ExeA
MSTNTFQFLNVGPYQEVISGISTVFSFSDGVAKLTGPLGVGKTALIAELVKELRAESFEVVEFKAPPKTPDDLQASLIRQFKLGADLSFRKSLIRYISTKPRDLQKLILVFDDAEQINATTLQGVHSLRELEHNAQPLISLLLCGDKTLNARLNQPELATLQADISLNYTLNPLEDEILSEFCSAYLQLIGKGKLVLAQSYLTTLAEQTRGLPEPVLQQLARDLRDPVFLLVNGRQGVAAEVPEPTAKLGQVIQGITDQLNNIPPETKRWLKPATSVLFTAAALSTAYIYAPRVMSLYGDFMKGGTNTETTVATTPPPVPAQPQTATDPTPAVVATQPAATPALPPIAAEVATPAAVATTSPVATPTPATPVSATTATAVPAPPQTATVAPLPTPTVPVANVAVAPLTGGGDLRQVVENWLIAWRSQNPAAYLAYYHTDFAPLYHNSRSSWTDDRTRSLTRPSSIELTLSDLEIADSDITGTKVRFWLTYQSPTYADRTFKELVLGRDLDGQTRILLELNRDVEVLPAGRLLATTAPQTAPTGQDIETGSGPSMTQIGEAIVAQANAQTVPLPNNQDSINQFINSWLNAWQHQDLNGYFSHYVQGFKTSAMATADDWRHDRILKISRPNSIQLSLVELELIEETTEGAVLRMSLEYHSSFYADRTQKELQLRRLADGSLQIVVEKNILVEPLPLARLVPPNTVAMRGLVRSVYEVQL